MQLKINASWQKHLQPEFEKPYFQELVQKVEEEYTTHICFPPKDLIFNAFNYCSFEDLKVVIIGQDPYHGDDEANGLAFSVNDNVKIPPSLKNIFKEINLDFERILDQPEQASGNLERWAKQGVLLLNATLTVRKDLPNSHKDLKWQQFTDAVIQTISNEKENVVFLLWGSFAQQKERLIDTTKHFVLTSGHPSFASVHKKFYGNHHFSKTNAILESVGKVGVEW